MLQRYNKSIKSANIFGFSIVFVMIYVNNEQYE
jgi:hypothetical protein